jgi:hypothetical protein
MTEARGIILELGLHYGNNNYENLLIFFNKRNQKLI